MTENLSFVQSTHGNSGTQLRDHSGEDPLLDTILRRCVPLFYGLLCYLFF